MDKEEVRLEILRIVLESGSEKIKSDPLPSCEKYYTWVSKENENSSKKSKTIRKNLTDNKE
tara:strand:+ start:589 stop:771 length:183 start_codon:yes stop_codon:yes gene_type:complete